MKMSQTNEQLNRICIEHGVHVIADMHREIVEFWDSIPNDTRLAIRGAGKHTVELFNLVRYWEKNIVGIFDDSKFHEEDLPYPILDVAEMDKFDIDTIYFASYHHRFDMMDALKDKFPESKYKYLDLYSYFVKKKDRWMRREFFEEVYFHEMFYVAADRNTKVILELYYARKYYEKGKKVNSQYAEYYLRVLISDYIKERDFANAFLYVDEYVANRYEYQHRYQNFSCRLKDFLEEIKTTILLRKSSDYTIIFMLIDGLSYEVFRDRGRYKMDFLHEYTDKNGVEFEKAYSPCTYTTQTMRSIYLKENVFSEKFYDINIKDSKSNYFYRYLKDKGFRIKTYGVLDLEASRTGARHNRFNMLMWKVLCDLSENDKSTFYYIHETGLFHFPTQCGRQSHIPICWLPGEVPNLQPTATREEAFKDSAEYLDKSMAFYFGYLPEKSQKVIFSDHGWIDGKRKLAYHDCNPWKEEMIHVPLLVFSKSIKPQKVKTLYSTFYLSDLLRSFLDEDIIFSIQEIEFTQSSFTLLYNPDTITEVKKTDLMCPPAFRAVISLIDKYVITYAGQEYYYKLPDETTNLINHPECQERIQYIKSKNDLSFPDFKHPKFKETRHFYFDELDRPTQFFDE